MAQGNADRYTTEQVIRALNAAQGYVSAAAEILRCTPQTVYNYRNRYPEVAEAWAGIYERRLDMAENRLIELTQNDDPRAAVPATIYLLKTQGRSRGWAERQEVLHLTAGDMKRLSDDQLERLAAGKLPAARLIADGAIEGDYSAGDDESDAGDAPDNETD